MRVGGHLRPAELTNGCRRSAASGRRDQEPVVREGVRGFGGVRTRARRTPRHDVAAHASGRCFAPPRLRTVLRRPRPPACHLETAPRRWRGGNRLRRGRPPPGTGHGVTRQASRRRGCGRPRVSVVPRVSLALRVSVAPRVSVALRVSLAPRLSRSARSTAPRCVRRIPSTPEPPASWPRSAARARPVCSASRPPPAARTPPVASAMATPSLHR